MSIELANTEILGSRALIFHPNSTLTQTIEAYCDITDEFCGIFIFPASTIEESESIARKYAIELVFVPDFLDQSQIVTLGQSLRKVRSTIDIIAVPLSAPLILRSQLTVPTDLLQREVPEKPSTLESIEKQMIAILRTKRTLDRSKCAFDGPLK